MREQEKRRRTRAIADAARGLFDERGYAATTVEDIAAAAGIAPRTFFLHFRSKEDIVFAGDERRYALLQRHLAERPGGGDALTEMIAVLEEWLAAEGLDEDVLRERLIRESTVLAARDRVQLARYQRLVAAAIRADLGADDDDLRPEIAAAAAISGWEAVGAGRVRHPADPARIRRALDQVAAFVRAGLA